MLFKHVCIIYQNFQNQPKNIIKLKTNLLNILENWRQTPLKTKLRYTIFTLDIQNYDSLGKILITGNEHYQVMNEVWANNPAKWFNKARGWEIRLSVIILSRRLAACLESLIVQHSYHCVLYYNTSWLPCALRGTTPFRPVGSLSALFMEPITISAN